MVFIIPKSLISTFTQSGYLAEDSIDRLNSHVSVYLLMFFAVVTASKQTFGKPLVCMTPAESPDSWRTYYQDYCYIQNKVRLNKSLAFIPNSEIFENAPSAYWQSEVVYYQWVPFILAVQAVLFLVPRIFWRFFGATFCNGTEVEQIIKEARKLRCAMGEDRKTGISNLANFTCETMKFQKRNGVFGDSLAVCYVIRKSLMFFFVAVQFLWLSKIFVEDQGDLDFFWGWKILMSALYEVRSPASGVFPNVIRCDVDRVEMGNMNRVSMQCVLMLNFINEKIYLLIYFWLAVLLFLNLVSLIYYVLVVTVHDFRSSLADSLIPSQDVMMKAASAHIGVPAKPDGRIMLDFFIDNQLRRDGVLLLSFISTRAGGMVTFELAQQIWNRLVQPVVLPKGTVSSEKMDVGENCYAFPHRKQLDSNGNNLEKPKFNFVPSLMNFDGKRGATAPPTHLDTPTKSDSHKFGPQDALFSGDPSDPQRSRKNAARPRPDAADEQLYDNNAEPLLGNSSDLKNCEEGLETRWTA